MSEAAHYKSDKYPSFGHNDEPCIIINRLHPLRVDIKEHGTIVTHVVYGAMIQFKGDHGKYLVNVKEELPGSPLVASGA